MPPPPKLLFLEPPLGGCNLIKTLTKTVHFLCVLFFTVVGTSSLSPTYKQLVEGKNIYLSLYIYASLNMRSCRREAGAAAVDVSSGVDYGKHFYFS